MGAYWIAKDAEVFHGKIGQAARTRSLITASIRRMSDGRFSHVSTLYMTLSSVYQLQHRSDCASGLDLTTPIRIIVIIKANNWDMS